MKGIDQPWSSIPAVAQAMVDADHIDVKTFEGDVSLREFLANVFSYYPWWIKFLYQVRWVFVRMLGMSQNGIPQHVKMRPEDVPMTVGHKAEVFEIIAAEEDHYLVSKATESHLTAHLIIVQDQEAASPNCFHFMTIVHYHRWTGPVYFNVIRPFHHLVVNQMGLAGIGA